MRMTPKIAIAAGAVTLGAAGIAGAVTAPEAAEPGLSKAAEQVGVELPASRDAHPGADPSTDDSSTEVEETEEAEETEQTDEVEEQDAHEDNHGAAVSAVAQTDHGSGREHGEAVSNAARENHGAEAKAGAAERGSDDDDVEVEETEGDDD